MSTVEYSKQSALSEGCLLTYNTDSAVLYNHCKIKTAFLIYRTKRHYSYNYCFVDKLLSIRHPVVNSSSGYGLKCLMFLHEIVHRKAVKIIRNNTLIDHHDHCQIYMLIQLH